MHRDMQSAWIAELAYIAAQLGLQILKSDIGAQRFATLYSVPNNGVSIFFAASGCQLTNWVHIWHSITQIPLGVLS